MDIKFTYFNQGYTLELREFSAHVFTQGVVHEIIPSRQLSLAAFDALQGLSFGDRRKFKDAIAHLATAIVGDCWIENAKFRNERGFL